MNDVFTQVIEMDTGVAEHVVKNKDDSYTIFLNARLSYERQLEAYYHAMKHIEGDDFSKYDVQEIESNVRGIYNEDLKPIPATQYLEELMILQREHKALKRRIKQDEERIRFLKENYSMYDRAENCYLYAGDL